MAKTNTKRDKVFTHEGAPAVRVNPELQLRRSVLSCLLWESEFYEDGASIAERIAATIPRVKADKVAAIAVEARSKYHLRHAPLWIIREMARLDSHKGLVADTLEAAIQRADELTEFVALYWKDGRRSLSMIGLGKSNCETCSFLPIPRRRTMSRLHYGSVSLTARWRRLTRGRRHFQAVRVRRKPLSG